jgi:DNA-binding GntR family transcriptional regulator
MNDVPETERSIPPISRTSLHDMVTARVRDLIVEGRLAAGERINESRLCMQLGVSRTPLREALKVLASEGLVELTSHRGATVATCSIDAVRDMMLLMSRLEAFACELAAARATRAELASLRNAHDAMVEAFRAGDRTEYFRINQGIHCAVVAIAGNRSLGPFHGLLHARMKRFRYQGNDLPENWAESVVEHEAIMAALERRDGRAAAAAMQAHLENAWRRVATVMGVAISTGTREIS